MQFAKNQPLDTERIRRQLEKLGNTAYEWEALEIETDGNIFVPMKDLNQVRRDAITALEEEILRSHRRSGSHPKTFARTPKPKKAQEALNMYVSCEDAQTAQALLQEEGVKGLYLPFDLMKQFLEEGRLKGVEMYLSTPYVVRGPLPEKFLSAAKEWLEKGMSGFLVRSWRPSRR